VILTILKGILVLFLAIPFSLLALISIPIDPTGKLFHWSSWGWAKTVLWVFGITVHVEGLDRIKGMERVIYVANHASWFDIPAMVVGIPDQIRIVFKKELTWVPIWGWALKYGPYIAIDRAKPKDAIKSLDKAADQIRKGASVLLFAEGTRTRDGKLQPFKRGAFALAVRSGVNVVPATINNSYRILPKGSLNVKPADIRIILGNPIPTLGKTGKDGEKELMKQVHDVITHHFVEPV
jgi:1-acyl-sn-glycerol-3-phosphate acyltransferase